MDTLAEIETHAKRMKKHEVTLHLNEGAIQLLAFAIKEYVKPNMHYSDSYELSALSNLIDAKRDLNEYLRSLEMMEV